MATGKCVPFGQVDGDTGQTVWDGTILLAKYLEHGLGRAALQGMDYSMDCSERLSRLLCR